MEVSTVRQPARQAVLVIHGIGSQRPLETIRSFVEQVWLQDRDGRRRPGRRLWYRPDTTSGNFDLAQIVANEKDRARTDFFELYWAHLMEGTRFASVWAWFWNDLVRRRTEDMPRPMQEAKTLVLVTLLPVLLLFATTFGLGGTLALRWIGEPAASVFVSIAFLAAVFQAIAGWRLIPVFLFSLALVYAIRDLIDPAWPRYVAFAAIIVGILLFWLERTLLSPYIGDAARYLRNTPENVAARQEIRKLGVEVLDQLHDPRRKYDRIIVIGHSLGTIVGYDILRYSFAARMRDANLEAQDAPEEVERWAEASNDPRAPAFMAAQRELCRSIGERLDGKRRWLVTDFVTLGSPLAYSNILNASSDEDFRTRIDRRLLPTCPPQRELDCEGKPPCGFYTWRDRETGSLKMTPHHGAVFAFTRWTNLYFPARAVIWGDIIGGPVGRSTETCGLGEGIKDVAIDCTHLFERGLFSHTSYWTIGGEHGDPTHIEALQRALDLEDACSASTLGERTCDERPVRIFRRASLPPISAGRDPSS